MTLMRSTSQLATSVDQLTGETNITKAQLDAKVALVDVAVVATQGEQAVTEVARDEAAAHAADADNHLATVKAGVTYQGISAILASKAVTAVDVFVYDTSLDSDGGAWRTRCQHTSWYNEPLNTATRGARREFPAVAVIIAVAGDAITIYDADDPMLPMWMVFPRGSTTDWFDSAQDITCVSALNSVVCVGSKFDEENRGGLRVLNFASDTGQHFAGTYQSYNGYYAGGIAQRGITGRTYNGSGNLIVDRRVTDVALAALPNAPIELTTGLPVPTIAVSTLGGVSIIKDSGAVVNDLYARSVYRLEFADSSLVWCPTSNPENWFITDKIGDVEDGWVFSEYLRREDLIGDDYPRGPQATSANTRHAYLGDSIFATSNTVAPSAGVFLYQRGRAVSFNKNEGLIAKITSTFNSGWMLGDIRGAFLSSVDNSTLSGGDEITVNGEFETDTVWVKDSGWSIEGGLAFYDGATYGSLSQQNSGIQAGKTYRVTISIGTNASGAGQFFVQLKGAQSGQYNFASGTSYTFYLTAGSSGNDIGIYSNSAFPFTIAKISVVGADLDVSPRGAMKSAGLLVHGSIIREQVASGAELSGFRGFSDLNFLSLENTDALDTGSGDFSYMGWVFNPSIYDTFLSRSDGAGLGWYLQRGNGQFWFSSAVGGSINAGAIPDTGWSFICLSQNNGIVSGYVNAALIGTGLGSANMSIPNSVLTFGVKRPDLAGAIDTMTGKMALWRFSATAPTPDQLRKIYEDERKLFQPGAQCTLYGTSDAVTALAYDPKTNLLHIGTSACRSTFDGLQRVANTETPVTTAISAVNGLITEQ